MNLSLTDKVVFIGGASRGIGLAIARAFISEGARVVMTARDETRLTQAVATLGAPAGAVLTIARDMTIETEIQHAVEQTLATFGRLDSVVANIGNGSVRGGWELTTADWLTALQTNLLGSMALATAALPTLITRGGGSLIFISSIAGWEAMNAPVSYSAAKAALLSAVKNLARLTGPQGVRVNAVVPGNILFSGGNWERKLATQREFFENYIRTEVPLQRFGRPEEIADAVTFLASMRATFITGACLVVDGGQTRSF
jgi:3-oxoacyl-[acyl-carrier protein] reductase